MHIYLYSREYLNTLIKIPLALPLHGAYRFLLFLRRLCRLRKYCTRKAIVTVVGWFGWCVSFGVNVGRLISSVLLRLQCKSYWHSDCGTFRTQQHIRHLRFCHAQFFIWQRVCHAGDFYSIRMNRSVRPRIKNKSFRFRNVCVCVWERCRAGKVSSWIFRSFWVLNISTGND